MALSLDGIDDQIDHGDIAALDALSALTICLWLKVVTLTVNGGALSKCTLGAGTDGFSCQYYSANDNFGFAISASTNVGYVVGGIDVGVWAHWAVVYDGSQADNPSRVKIYKNGVAQSLSFAGTIPASIADSAQPLRVGRGREATYTPEEIAHVKLYAAALTPAAVARDAKDYLPRRVESLQLWAPYDSGVNQARDYSGRGNHGTPTGTGVVADPAGVRYGPQVLLPRGKRGDSGRRRQALTRIPHRWYAA